MMTKAIRVLLMAGLLGAAGAVALGPGAAAIPGGSPASAKVLDHAQLAAANADSPAASAPAPASTTGGAASTQTTGASPVITIDTDKAQGISVGKKGAAGAAATPSAPVTPQAGPVSRAINHALPQTGVSSVDKALKTLSETLAGFVDGFINYLPLLFISLVVLVVTGIAGKVIPGLARRGFDKMRLQVGLRDLFGQLIYIGIWFIGLVAAAAIVFPTFGMGQIVATAGLASIAIGFAFQDIFQNFFAGILILWNFPFNTGDFIEIEATKVEGRVEDIWIRMTLVRKTNGELLCVPNSTISKNPVRVLTHWKSRRLSVSCGVAYGENVGQARAVIHKALEGCETVLKDRPIQIFLTGFGASSMDYEMAWWTGPTPLDERRSRDEVVQAVKFALDDAGIEIPYPYRTLTFTPNEPLIYETLGRNTAPALTDERARNGESGDTSPEGDG